MDEVEVQVGLVADEVGLVAEGAEPLQVHAVLIHTNNIMQLEGMEEVQGLWETMGLKF